MKIFLFAIHDSASGVYDGPLRARSEGEMLRGFTDITMDAEHPVGKHPEFYSLFEVGMWDDNKGELTPSIPARFIVKAIDLVKAGRKVDSRQLSLIDEKISDSDKFHSELIDGKVRNA